MLFTSKKVLELGLLLFLASAARALEQSPSEDYAFLGLQTEAKNGEAKGGLIVTFIFPASSAKEIGFEIGDEVKAVNDVLIFDQQSFVKELRKENVGAKLRFLISRGGKDMNLQGRIGSFQKTMKVYQDLVRKQLEGKPLPPLPGAAWWNPETKQWDEKANGMDFLRGKLSVVFSFDGCKYCQKTRLERISQMKNVLATTGGDAPVAFAGIYYDDKPPGSGKEKNLKAAADLFSASPPVIPIAVAFYPGDKPTQDAREKQVIIHNHGVAILDPKGNVKYIQVVGDPEQEFWIAYQKALEEVRAAGKGKSEEGSKGASGKSSGS